MAEIKIAAKKILARTLDYYQPHEKQQIFHALGALCPERLLMGGNRTGKTYGGCGEGAYHLTGYYPDDWEGRVFDHPVRMWAASDSLERTRDILQSGYLGNDSEGIIGTIPPHLIIKITYRKGDAAEKVYVQHKNGGISVLQFKSYDQKRKKFQGTSQHVIHLDEEPPLDVYTECLLRILDCSGIVYTTMTPLSGMTKVCQKFMRNSVAGVPKNGIVYDLMTWEDNPYLPEAEKKRLLQTLSPRELASRRDGIPDAGGGRAHPDFNSENIKELEDRGGPLWIGMDFNVDNMSAVIGQKANLDLEIFSEIVLPERSNTQMMADTLKSLFPNRKIYICPDASGASSKTSAPIGTNDHTILRDAGFEVVTNKKNPFIKDRVENVNRMICNGQGERHLFVDPSCEQLVECLSNLVCPEGTIIPDKKNGLDHLPDGLGYLVNQLFPIIDPIQKSKARGR